MKILTEQEFIIEFKKQIFELIFSDPIKYMCNYTQDNSFIDIWLSAKNKYVKTKPKYMTYNTELWNLIHDNIQYYVQNEHSFYSLSGYKNYPKIIQIDINFKIIYNEFSDYIINKYNKQKMKNLLTILKYCDDNVKNSKFLNVDENIKILFNM